MIRVLLVHHQPRLRERLGESLALEPDLNIVGVAASEASVRAKGQQLEADVILSDLVVDDIEDEGVISGIRVRCPRCDHAIVTLLRNPSPSRSARTIELAGSGTSQSSSELLWAIRLVGSCATKCGIGAQQMQ